MLKVATSATYWILVAIWSYVLYFYVSRLRNSNKTSKLVNILFIVLTVDAFRTLFESIYFGAWYTSLSGFIPAHIGQILTRPEYVFIPKIVNVIAGVAVVRIILNYWVPEEKREREQLVQHIDGLEDVVRIRTDELQELFDGAALGLLTVNSQGGILNANREACARLGYEHEEYSGLGFSDLIESSNAARDIEASMAVMKPGESIRLESCWKHKNETQIQVEMIVQRMQKREEFLVMFLDITERVAIEARLQESEIALLHDIAVRKRTEDALAKSEIRFRKALLEAPFPIMIHADGGEVMLISRAWSDITGYTHEDIPTITDWTGKAYGEQMMQVRKHINYLYSANERRDEGEYEIRCKDGSTRIWYFYSVPLESFAAGRHIVMSMAFDLTEYKRLERELLSAKLDADSSNKAKGEFLANMSHEIRTPLNGILGMLQLIDSTPLNSEQEEFVSIAKLSTNRLSRLLSDILDLSRIEAGRLILEEDPFDILEQKKMVLELFAEPARKKGLRLDFAIDENVPNQVRGDKMRLQQILFNLVGNSVKFTEKGSIRVEISKLPMADVNQSRLLFSISDTGIGISDEQIKHIFEPFVQVENTYSRRFQGAGLGLSIVHRLVSLMDGELAIDNTAGGTTIYVTLPFKIAELTDEKQSKPLMRHNGQVFDYTRLHILLVEDDSVSLMFGKRLLEKCGHTVVTAINGKEAVELVEKQPFDVIFMDIQMPIMDGVEATRVIRESTSLGARSRTPIIAMTAYAMVGEEEQFLSAGMDGYIAKPTEGKTIKSVMHRVLKASGSLSHSMNN